MTGNYEHWIVWIDDDVDDLELFASVLQEANQDVRLTTFLDGNEALGLLREEVSAHHFPCLVILDMNMPLLNGRDFIVRVKNDPQLQELALLVFTTSSSPLDKTFCDRFGVEMVTKPNVLEELKETVARMTNICMHNGARRRTHD